MKVKEIMTSDAVSVTQNVSLSECAKKMSVYDIGVLPITEENRVCGIITDRDLVIRALAEELDPHKVPIKEIMSSPVNFCFEEDEIETAIRLMEVKQVRRLVVLNRKKRLSGILTLSDVATRSQEWELTEEALEKITERHVA